MRAFVSFLEMSLFIPSCWRRRAQQSTPAFRAQHPPPLTHHPGFPLKFLKAREEKSNKENPLQQHQTIYGASWEEGKKKIMGERWGWRSTDHLLKNQEFPPHGLDSVTFLCWEWGKGSVSSPGSNGSTDGTSQSIPWKFRALTGKQVLVPKLPLEGQEAFFSVADIFAFPSIKLL